MDISTKTVTTKVHTAVATPDSLKSVAILAVVRQLGLTDDVVLSSEAEVLADGSISVEVIESVPDAPEASAVASPSGSPSDAAAISDPAAASTVPPAAPPVVGFAMPNASAKA